MKASEFRVGNYFTDRGGKVLRLDFWDLGMKPAQKIYIEGVSVHPITEELEYCQPIPLTEEVLLKCGFEKHPMADCYLIAVCEGVMMAIDLFGNLEIGDDFKKGNILFLHQLQNLYFALTGQELNVQL